MTVNTIRCGKTMIVNAGRSASLIFFGSEAVANNVQRRLKDIDADLEARRLDLYRDALGDGSLGALD